MKAATCRATGGALALLLGVSLNAFAQPTARKEKPISPADQRAITALFKGVDSSKYRLQFNGGKRVLGAKKVEMRDIEQVKKFTNPGEAAGWIVLIVEGKDVIYVLAVGGSELEAVLGKEKAARLNQVMAKYAR